LETNMSGRHEDHSNVGAFICGLLTGATLGAAVAMLFAPKPGWKMRREVVDGAGHLGQEAKDRWGDVREAVSSAVDTGRETYDQAMGTVQQVAESAGKSVDRAKDAVKRATGN
jgi:gas vesicle protein